MRQRTVEAVNTNKSRGLEALGMLSSDTLVFSTLDDLNVQTPPNHVLKITRSLSTFNELISSIVFGDRHISSEYTT